MMETVAYILGHWAMARSNDRKNGCKSFRYLDNSVLLLLFTCSDVSVLFLFFKIIFLVCRWYQPVPTRVHQPQKKFPDPGCFSNVRMSICYCFFAYIRIVYLFISELSRYRNVQEAISTPPLRSPCGKYIFSIYFLLSLKHNDTHWKQKYCKISTSIRDSKVWKKETSIAWSRARSLNMPHS